MTRTTTAAVLVRHGGPEALEVRDDWVVGDPGPGEALVRVTAAGVNNTDLWTRRGAYGKPGDPDAESGWAGPLDFPRVQGGDVAGVVETTGDGVDTALVGRRVLVDPAYYRDTGPTSSVAAVLGSERDGGFAGYLVVEAGQLHDVSGSPLSDEELACLPIAYGTAAGMLRRADVRAGETVLVTGSSGGVGIALVQLARARGATVIGVSTRAKASAVTDAGAHHVVARDGDDLPGQIRALAPEGLHAVADVVGGDAMGDLVPLLRDEGRWVIAGAIAGPVVTLDLRPLYLHSRRLIGSTMHSRKDFETLAALAREGAVRPPIAARFPLAGIHQAQEVFATSRHIGKIVLLP